MRLYYKPKENQIIQNFAFRHISQLPRETFSAFCNRVEAAGIMQSRGIRNIHCTKNEVLVTFGFGDIH